MWGIFKIAAIGVGAIVVCVIVGFLILVFIMSSASRRGYSKIDTLKKEFAPNTSVENLIDRAEQLTLNSIWWTSDSSKESFEDQMGIPASSQKSLNLKNTMDFKTIKEKFAPIQSGTISLLAYGSLPIQRFILTINFTNRTVASADIRVID